MAITYNALEFKVVHETKLASIILVLTIWNAVIGQLFDVKPDNTKEALEYDKYGMDIFKSDEDEDCGARTN